MAMREINGNGPTDEMGQVSSSYRTGDKEHDYEIKEVLGRGAYGICYRVIHSPTKEEFALKRIVVGLTDEGIPQSVLREVAAMQAFRNLQHKNIIKLHDVFHTIKNNGLDLHVNIITEKCEWDLYTFLKGIPEHMPEKQCKILAKQILEGVDYLHSRNILHRDLKPQNIMVNPDLSLKIVDFGLSRTYSASAAFTTVVVTLWYRSPEVLLQGSYRSSVDIWAVGCILTELYERAPLFPGQNETQQLSIIFQKLGLPHQNEWPSDAVVNRTSFPAYQPISFKTLCPRLCQSAISLVQCCLKFDDSKRITARSALRHPYFN